MNEKDSTCRWGILGSAGIARKNWQSIKYSGNGELVAVASRSLDRAEEFVAECQAQIPQPRMPRAVGSYEELIAADDIDALYIPLPTGIRKEYVLKAAAAGKHVLCEKPCAVNAADLQEQIEACEKAGVQFMDGVMFMHTKRLMALREVLEKGDSIGDIRRIATQFSFMMPDDFLQENIRVHSSLEPLGCLGDLGWYCIRMILWTMNYEMPTAVTGRLISEQGGSDSPDTVPIQLSAELIFPGRVTASIYCSFETENQQWVNISGTKGHIAIEDFVLPYFGSNLEFSVSRPRFEVDCCQFHMEKHDQRVSIHEYSDSHPSAQETRLFQKFGELVLSGKPDPHWPDIALKTQQIMDACLASARNGGQEETI